MRHGEYGLRMANKYRIEKDEKALKRLREAWAEGVDTKKDIASRFGLSTRAARELCEGGRA